MSAYVLNWYSDRHRNGKLAGLVCAENEKEAQKKLCLTSRWNDECKKYESRHPSINGVFWFYEINEDRKAWWMEKTTEISSLNDLIHLCAAKLPTFPV